MIKLGLKYDVEKLRAEMRELMESGVKHDDGKLRMDLLPPKSIEELARVLTYGAAKYGDNNWVDVETNRYVAALLRHLFAWMGGEERDEESGIHHLSHVMCNAAFLVYKEVEDENETV
jgi:hypothetical protein